MGHSMQWLRQESMPAAYQAFEEVELSKLATKSTTANQQGAALDPAESAALDPGHDARLL